MFYKGEGYVNVPRHKYGKSYKDTAWVQAEINEVNPNIIILNEYKDRKSYLKLQCKKCNHDWENSFISLKNSKFKCPNCEKILKKYEFEKVTEIKENPIKISKLDKVKLVIKELNSNIEVLENSYFGDGVPLLLRCTLCNEYWTKSYNGLKKDYKCPKCKNNK